MKPDEKQKKRTRCEYVGQRIRRIIPKIYDDKKCSWQVTIEFLKLCRELKEFGIEESSLMLPYLGSASRTGSVGAWALPYEIGINMKLSDAALFLYKKGFLSKEDLEWFADGDQQLGALIERLDAQPKRLSFYIYVLKNLFGKKADDDGCYCEGYTELSLFLNLQFAEMDDGGLLIDGDTLASNDGYKRSYRKDKEGFTLLNQEIKCMNSYLGNILEPINGNYHNGIKISAENVKRLQESNVFFDIKPSNVVQKSYEYQNLQGHSLSNELLLHIFQYLPAPVLLGVIPLVNRNWQDLARDNKIWVMKYGSTYSRKCISGDGRSINVDPSVFYKAFQLRQLRDLAFKELNKMALHIMEAKNNGFFIVSTVNESSDRKIDLHPDCIIIRSIPKDYALTILRFMREKYHIDLSQKGVLIRENASSNFDIRISIPQLKILLNKIKTYNTPNYSITPEMQETDQMLGHLQRHLNDFAKHVASYRKSDSRLYAIGYGPPGPITLTELMSHLTFEKNHVVLKYLASDKARIIIDFIENIYNKNVCKTFGISPIKHSKNDYVIPGLYMTRYYTDIKFSRSNLKNLFSAINTFNQFCVHAAKVASRNPSAVNRATQQSSATQSDGLFATPQPQPVAHDRNIQHPNKKLLMLMLPGIIKQKHGFICKIQRGGFNKGYKLVFSNKQIAEKFEKEYRSYGYGYSLGKEFNFLPGKTSKFLELFSSTQSDTLSAKPPEKDQDAWCQPS